ncbi:MAG: GNAT family N-acetyltransferase [Rhodobacteraceae bacterium]|nr:GNAT family N-acetyltransferase [Paracoccaceae bacterium]
MKIVWGGQSNPDDNRIMADWCSNQIWGDARGFGNCTTMGVLLDDSPVAVMVFHNWQPDGDVIEISGAATNKRWLSRQTLHAMFSYVFDTIGCQLAVMRTSPNDKAIARILKSYGFKSHRIPRLRGRHEDELINTLTDDAWKNNRFERRNNGKTKSTAAP